MNLKASSINIFVLVYLATLALSSVHHINSKIHIRTSNKLRYKLKRINRALEDYLSKAREDIESSSDKEMMPIKAMNIDAKDVKGVIMRVVKPKDAKPVYFNMSPLYDFRNYII